MPHVLTDDQKLDIAITVERDGIMSGISKLNEHLGYILPLESRIALTKQIYSECGGDKITYSGTKSK